MQFINGKWLEGKGQKFNSINPANDEVIWSGNEATAGQVAEAIKAAHSAFDTWSELELDQRKKYLENFTTLLNENREELAELIAKETGKPLWESRMELGGMIGKLPIALEAYETRTGTLTKEIKAGLSATRHKAHGVIAIFGPFNFPGHISNGHILPALLAGNTLVFKPSEQTPAVAQKIIELWEKAGIPKGVLNLVQGGPETGKALSTNENIDGLFFTGSSQTGKILHQQFAGYPEKILALEMGGNNPLLISKISNIDAAAYLAIQSTFITSGQRCVCARRLILEEGKEGDELLKKLIEMSSEIKVGAYNSEPEPFMGPLISKESAKASLDFQEELKKKGGEVLLEAKSLSSAMISPGIIEVTNIKDREDKEIFGPILQVIRVKNFDEAIKEANNTKYGLSAGLISDDKNLFDKFFKKSRAGIVNWNQQLTGASSSAPFGGIGVSGNHRPSAYYAADYCAYPVASLENSKLEMPSSISPGIKLTGAING